MKLDDARALQAQIQADMDREGTLEVVVYAGPGAGKSVFRAEAFAELKKRGRNAEEVTEVAKDYTWEEAVGKLAFQPLMMAKQMWKLRRLQGKVDVILTDTSTLYSLVYGGPREGVTAAFRDYIIDDYRRRNTLNFLLVRNPNIPYEVEGRNQGTLDEAKSFDQTIVKMLDDAGIPYEPIEIDLEGGTHVQRAVDKIENLLDLSTYSGFRPAGMSMADWNAAGRPSLFNEFVKGEVSTLEDAKQIEGFEFANGLTTEQAASLVVTGKQLLEMPEARLADPDTFKEVLGKFQ